MAWHLYLLPVIVSGKDRAPKYVEALAVPYGMKDYGYQPDCLVAADVSGAQHTGIIGNADVQFIPDNLDQPIGAALTTVQTALSTRHIPDGWVTSGMTYRFVVKVVVGAFHFLQRFAVVTGIVIPVMDGINIDLNTQWQDLSAANRQRLLDTAATYPLDVSQFSGTSTLRQILKGVSDQLRPGKIELGGITI